MDTSALENIGLTKNEISIYVSLLELGSVRAGAIVDKSGLQNSVVHLGLKKLIQKGFVSFVKEGKVRRFHACDPDNILRYIDEKRKSCEDLIPALIAKQEHQERQDAEIFEGINGFKNMLYQFMEGGKKGDEYLFFSFWSPSPSLYDEVYEFYREFEDERSRRGFKVKGIVPSSVKDKFKGRKKSDLLFVDHPTFHNISILNNKVVMTPWEEDRQVSFLISSRQLAQNFRHHFNSIWAYYKMKKQ